MNCTKKCIGFVAFFGITLITTLGSCEKALPDDELIEGATTPKITDGSWVLTSSVGVTPFGTFDIYATLEACEKDDILTFDTSKKWIIDEGASKCDSVDSQVKTGNYTIKNDNELIIYDQGDTAELVIKEVTASQLVLELIILDTATQLEFTGVLKYKH